jgi:hypothetical protein
LIAFGALKVNDVVRLALKKWLVEVVDEAVRRVRGDPKSQKAAWVYISKTELHRALVSFIGARPLE